MDTWSVLGRQLKPLALKHLGDVQVEEVAVEDGLDAASHNRYQVIESWKERSI
jgi:hypothetical protein